MLSSNTLVKAFFHLLFSFLRRLLHVDYDESKLYMIFEYLDLDLKKYMDAAKSMPDGFTPDHVRVSILGKKAMRACLLNLRRVTCISS